MKKVLLIIFALLAFINVDAKQLYFKASSVSYCLSDKRFTKWTPCDINVLMNLDENKIIVFSSNKQVLTYDNFVKTEENDGFIQTSDAIDSNYDKAVVQIYVKNDNSTFLCIEYKKMILLYKLEPISWQE